MRVASDCGRFDGKQFSRCGCAFAWPAAARNPLIRQVLRMNGAPGCGLCLEFGDDLGGEGLFGFFVLGAGVAYAVDCEKEEVLALQGIERRARPCAAHKEGVRRQPRNRHQPPRRLHRIPLRRKVGRVLQRHVHARLALRVRPRAIRRSATLAGPGLARLYGCVEHGLDLGKGDESARGGCVRLCGRWPGSSEGGEEDGCSDDGEAGRAQCHVYQMLTFHK
jgi:hypothetical protein